MSERGFFMVYGESCNAPVVRHPSRDGMPDPHDWRWPSRGGARTWADAMAASRLADERCVDWCARITRAVDALRKRLEPACGMYGDFSTCRMFRKRVPFDSGKPSRLPECIAAEQEARHVGGDRPVIQVGKHGQPIEPECPECGVGVDRPKCFHELGGYCPRHDLQDAYRQAVRDYESGSAKADRVATDPVSAPCQDAADKRARAAQGGEE